MLGTCWINQKEVRRIVGWPRNILPISLIVVGWPSGERKTRSRLAVEKITKWI